MADITRVAHSVHQTNGTTIVVPRPAGLLNGDIITVSITESARRATIDPIVAPAGWALVPGATQTTTVGGITTRASMYARQASDEPATWSWTVDPVLVRGTGTLVVYRGAVLPADAVDTATGVAAVGPVTTTEDVARLIAVFVTFAGTGTLTAPPGMTTLANTGGDMVVADEVATLAGPTGTRTVGAPSAATIISALLVALKPANRPPLAPTLVDAGTVDFTAGHRLRGVFNDPDAGDTPSERGLRRKVGAGAYEYWTGTAWTATEATWVATTVDFIDFAGGTGGWANGTTYQWSMRYKDQDGEPGPWAADSTIVGSARPTVNVTAPTGTVNTLRTTGEWTYSDPEANPQERYEAKVYTEAAATAGGFDPSTTPATWESGEVVSAATSRQSGAVLDNLVAHRFYVRAAQSGGLWSDWDHTTFTPDVEAPAVPTLTAAPQGQDSVLITVTGNDTTYAGLTVHRVERSDDGGATWAPVRGGTDLVPVTVGATQVSTVTDYEAPPHTPVLYRATVSTEEPGDLVETVSANTAPLTLTPRGWALKDPLEPGDNITLTVVDEPATFGRAEDQAVFGPLGDPAPVVISSVLRLAAGALDLLFLDRTSLDRFRVLRAKRRTLLLQAPWAAQWYVRLGPEAPETYMAATVDVDQMTVTVPVTVTEVAAP